TARPGTGVRPLRGTPARPAKEPRAPVPGPPAARTADASGRPRTDPDRGGRARARGAGEAGMMGGAGAARAGRPTPPPPGERLEALRRPAGPPRPATHRRPARPRLDRAVGRRRVRPARDRLRAGRIGPADRGRRGPGGRAHGRRRGGGPARPRRRGFAGRPVLQRGRRRRLPGRGRPLLPGVGRLGGARTVRPRGAAAGAARGLRLAPPPAPLDPPGRGRPHRRRAVPAGPRAPARAARTAVGPPRPARRGPPGPGRGLARRRPRGGARTRLPRTPPPRPGAGRFLRPPPRVP